MVNPQQPGIEQNAELWPHQFRLKIIFGNIIFAANRDYKVGFKSCTLASLNMESKCSLVILNQNEDLLFILTKNCSQRYTVANMTIRCKDKGNNLGNLSFARNWLNSETPTSAYFCFSMESHWSFTNSVWKYSEPNIHYQWCSKMA